MWGKSAIPILYKEAEDTYLSFPNPKKINRKEKELRNEKKIRSKANSVLNYKLLSCLVYQICLMEKKKRPRVPCVQDSR
jgi:hypothetical protein